MKKLLAVSIVIFASCAFLFGQNSNCPTISVTGPSSITQPGEPIPFSVSIDGEAQNTKLQFVWSVDKGKIIQGQETRTITVGELPSDSAMTATVEIKGLPEGCTNTDSETAIVVVCSIPSVIIAESDISSQHLSFSELNNLISELENNPSDSAYFIIYPHKKDSPDKLKNEENYIRNYLIANKIETDRLVFVTADSDESESGNSIIKIFLVPSGAEPPTP